MAGFITAEGLVIPAGSDTYDYVNDQRRLAASVRSIVPVAFDGTFSTIVSSMATDGRPVSDTNPLFAWNTNDKGLVYQGGGGAMLPLGPAKPMGHMGKTAGFQTIATTTQTLVTMTAAQVLLNGMTFDSATSSLVIPVTGYYKTTVHAYSTGGSGYEHSFITRTNNVLGTARAHCSFWKANSQDYVDTSSCTILYNAGDKVCVYTATDTNGLGSTWGTSGYDGVWLELEWVQGA